MVAAGALERYHVTQWALETPAVIAVARFLLRVEKLDASWGNKFESEEELAKRLTATLLALHDRYPGESVLALSHGGPCALGFQGVTGQQSVPCAGYTGLYVMVKGEQEQIGVI